MLDNSLFFPNSPFGTTLCSERFFDGILFIQPITQNILKYECITKSFSQLITYIFHSLLKHKKIEATQYSKIRIEILKVRAIRPKSKFSYFEIFRVNMINSNQYNWINIPPKKLSEVENADSTISSLTHFFPRTHWNMNKHFMVGHLWSYLTFNSLHKTT